MEQLIVFCHSSVNTVCWYQNLHHQTKISECDDLGMRFSNQIYFYGIALKVLKYSFNNIIPPL